VPFQGVLRISSTSPISVSGLRVRYNERSDFVITTIPAANESAPLPDSPVFFPQFADSGGYMTQFILFGAGPGSSASGRIRFFRADGRAAEMIIR
jgi:hypothetical protein